MGLFGSSRDGGLVRLVNRELLRKVIDIEVAIYKIAPEDSPVNIYGESSDKKYYDPIRIHALIDRDDSLSVNNETGEIEREQNIRVSFFYDDLVEQDVNLEIGDIIFWDGNYYEIDNISKTNYWWGRDPDTDIAIQNDNLDHRGMKIFYTAECHRTAITKLNIVDERIGINREIDDVKRPKNL